MSGVSDKAIRQGLYQKLNVASLTGLLSSGSASIFHANASQHATYPLVIFQKQSGIPIRSLTGSQMNNQIWVVKGVSRADEVPGSPSQAEEIAQAIDDLLDGKSLSISGGLSLFLMRDGDLDFPEIAGDEAYHHHGHLYRLITSAT